MDGSNRKAGVLLDVLVTILDVLVALGAVILDRGVAHAFAAVADMAGVLVLAADWSGSTAHCRTRGRPWHAGRWDGRTDVLAVGSGED
jgi:hypothetical protein